MSQMEHEKNKTQEAVEPLRSGATPEFSQSTSQKASKRPSLTSGLAEIGFYFSAAYIAFLALMGIIAWDLLWSMDPNEFGDLMAGVFAPLAFLWLVLGFFQQGFELRNSANALWLQMEELRNSVEQQKGLVEATRDLRQQEAEIFRTEQEAQARAAAPILRLRTGRSVMNGKVHRLQTFRLTNSGRDCFDVNVKIDGNDVISYPKIEGGQTVEFNRNWPATGEISENVDIHFFDSRGVEASVSFTLSKREGTVRVE